MTHLTCLLLVAVACVSEAHAQSVTGDIPYATAHKPQVLDVHAPAGAKTLPVVFWIHGGGWQTGDKNMVALKPKAFMDAGFVFVSINHSSRSMRACAGSEPLICSILSSGPGGECAELRHCSVDCIERENP